MQIDEGQGRFARGNVAANDLHIRVPALDLAHPVQHALGVPVRGIDDQHIDARGNECIDSLVSVATGADRGADPKRAGCILAREGEILGFLEVLGRDHAFQHVVVADDEHLFDAMLVQQAQHLLFGRAFADRDEAFLRGHHRGHGRIELRFEAQVAVRHDTDGHAVVDDGDAGNAHRARQFDDLANGPVRGHGDRVAHHARLEFLDDQDLACLLFHRHVLVNDADAALLGKRDRESRLGHRVHGRRQQRNAQANVPRQRRTEVDIAWQHFGVAGLQQDVVKCQGFLGNSHGGINARLRGSRRLYACRVDG